ncbi:MAG: WS/DGAT domain-containing protein [Gemmatimonadales bacterium]
MRERVSASDAVWLQDTATNLMVINGVFITDHMDIAAFRDAFQRRVIDAGGGQQYARFRDRLIRVRGVPYWETDPEFDIARQVVPAPVAALTTTEQLQQYVGTEASVPLPADRPPWQFQFIEHFTSDRSVVLARIHHSIGDGIALVSVIFALMEEMTAEHEMAPARGGIRPAAGALGQGLLKAMSIPFVAPGILAKRLLWRPDRHALHGAKVSGKKQVAWTAPFDLAVIKQARQQLDATVNDVLMAMVAGALSRYLARHAGQMVELLHISMPVNVRGAHEPLKLENRFAAVPLELPAGIQEIGARVRAVKLQMDELKRSVVPIVVYGIQRAMLTVLPQAVSRGLIDFLANKCTAVVTNVPGPQRELTLAGRRVQGLMFWVPQRADIGVGISILSFAGHVQVGILADTELVSDPRDLVRAFEEEFEALRAL